MVFVYQNSNIKTIIFSGCSVLAAFKRLELQAAPRCFMKCHIFSSDFTLIRKNISPNYIIIYIRVGNLLRRPFHNNIWYNFGNSFGGLIDSPSNQLCSPMSRYNYQLHQCSTSVDLSRGSSLVLTFWPFGPVWLTDVLALKLWLVLFIKYTGSRGIGMHFHEISRYPALIGYVPYPVVSRGIEIKPCESRMSRDRKSDRI